MIGDGTRCVHGGHEAGRPGTPPAGHRSRRRAVGSRQSLGHRGRCRSGCSAAAGTGTDRSGPRYRLFEMTRRLLKATAAALAGASAALCGAPVYAADTTRERQLHLAYLHVAEAQREVIERTAEARGWTLVEWTCPSFPPCACACRRWSRLDRDLGFPAQRLATQELRDDGCEEGEVVGDRDRAASKRCGDAHQLGSA